MPRNYRGEELIPVSLTLPPSPSPFALLLYIYIYFFFSRASRRLPLGDGKNPLKDFLRRIMAVNRQCPRKLVRGTIVPYAW